MLTMAGRDRNLKCVTRKIVVKLDNEMFRKPPLHID